MAFWNKNGNDEVKLSQEEYNQLKNAFDQLEALKNEVKLGDRVVLYRGEYNQLKSDGADADNFRLQNATQHQRINDLQSQVNDLVMQISYWKKQTALVKKQLENAQLVAKDWENKYYQVYTGIAKQVEKERNEAAKQDAADLMELQKQLQKEADEKIAKSLKDANQKLARASETDRNAALRLQKAQGIEKSNEAREKALKAREDAYTVREQNVIEREQAISGQLASAQNVYRIMRERANAARGIVPKKSHDGYLVLSSRQWKERYSAIVNGKKAQCSATVWKSVLETPYDVALAADQIKTQVENDLKLVMSDIGCHCMVSDRDNGRYKNSMEKIESSREKNVLYKWDLVANFKSGFWAIEIYTTKGLKVPESRRPVQKQSRKK